MPNAARSVCSAFYLLLLCRRAAGRASAGTKAWILLVDDHAMMRQGLRTILAGYEDLEVIGKSQGRFGSRCTSSLPYAGSHFHGYNLPKLDDIEATRRILQDRPSITIIDLSMHHALQVQYSMRQTGVVGYVTKKSFVEHLYAAIAKAIAEKRASHLEPETEKTTRLLTCYLPRFFVQGGWRI